MVNKIRSVIVAKQPHQSYQDSPPPKERTNLPSTFIVKTVRKQTRKVGFHRSAFLEMLLLLSSISQSVQCEGILDVRYGRSHSDRVFTQGGRAACSRPAPTLQRGRGAPAESPSVSRRRRSSGPGAAGAGCCQTASGPDPRWRQNRRKPQVWWRGSP